MLKYNEFIEKYDITKSCASWLWYTGLCQAIPNKWKDILKVNEFDVDKEKECIELELILRATKPSKLVYNFLIHKSTSNELTRYAERWFKLIDNTNRSYQNYTQLLAKIYATTQNVKL